MLEIILAFIAGIITAVITDIIVKLLPIGENVRFRILFNWRKFTKWVHNVPIKVSYTIKTQNLENKSLDVESLIKTIEEKLHQNDFRLKGKLGNSLIFTRIFGRSEIQATLSPSYAIETEESEKLMVSYVQGDFEVIDCKYKRLNGNLLELIQVTHEVEKSLREILGDWIAESLSCEIKRLYEYTGVFSELKLSSLTGEIGGKYKVSLSENKLTVYGALEQTLISMIKDVIAFYY